MWSPKVHYKDQATPQVTKEAAHPMARSHNTFPSSAICYRVGKRVPYDPSQSNGGDGSTCTWHARQEVEANWLSKLRIWHAPNSFAKDSCFARVFLFFELVNSGSSTNVHTPFDKTCVKEEFATGFVRLSAIWASLCTHRVMVWPRSSLWNTLIMSKILHFSFKQPAMPGPFWITSKRDLASVTNTPLTNGNTETGLWIGTVSPHISNHSIRTIISSSSAMEKAWISALKELRATLGSLPDFQLIGQTLLGVPSKIRGSHAPMKYPPELANPFRFPTAASVHATKTVSNGSSCSKGSYLKPTWRWAYISLTSLLVSLSVWMVGATNWLCNMLSLAPWMGPDW